MLLAIHLGMTLMFVILGIVFSKGKGAFLIAGYNTASKAEKQKTDEKKLCKFMGRLMFLLAACWLVIASSEIFKALWLLWVGLCLFFAVCVSGVIYMNTSHLSEITSDGQVEQLARPFSYRSCSCRLVRVCVRSGCSAFSAISTQRRIF